MEKFFSRSLFIHASARSFKATQKRIYESDCSSQPASQRSTSLLSYSKQLLRITRFMSHEKPRWELMTMLALWKAINHWNYAWGVPSCSLIDLKLCLILWEFVVIISDSCVFPRGCGRPWVELFIIHYYCCGERCETFRILSRMRRTNFLIVEKKPFPGKKGTPCVCLCESEQRKAKIGDGKINHFSSELPFVAADINENFPFY